MVRCWQCNGELTFRPISKTEIVLKCLDETCGFESLPLKLDPTFKPTQVSPIPEVIAFKPDNDETIKESVNLEQLKPEVVIENEVEKHAHIFEPESSVPQVVLTRNGELNEFSIFCLDFSNKMDREIPYKDEDLNIWRSRIQDEEILTEPIKESLLELTNPPISYLRTTLLAFSFLILENIKKMTVEDFHSFQIISMAGEAEEIFRFPSFQKQTTPGIISDFLTIMNLKRQDYRSNEILEYRDFNIAIGIISDLVIELKEAYPDENVQIYLLPIGDHKSTIHKAINPIREIKNKLEELYPFSFNILHLAQNGSEKIYQQITKRFNGLYSKEITFNSLMNAITYKKYGTEKSLAFQVAKPQVKKLEKPEEIEMVSEEKILTNKPHITIDQDYLKRKNVEVSEWDKNFAEIIIKNEADEILEKLIKKSGE